MYVHYTHVTKYLDVAGAMYNEIKADHSEVAAQLIQCHVIYFLKLTEA